MRALIVEDDLVSRNLLLHYLSKHGDCDVAVDGVEAVEAVRMALDRNAPYDLICLDIMMPKMSGQEALRSIRNLEGKCGLDFGRGAKIVMTTALSDPHTIMDAFKEQCDSYLTKPIEKDKLEKQLKVLGLIQ
jgi:two-component system chemotaxis response regulator CheY